MASVKIANSGRETCRTVILTGCMLNPYQPVDSAPVISQPRPMRSQMAPASLLSASPDADRQNWCDPEGPGISPEKSRPVKWSAGSDLTRKTALPGFAVSSPVTLGDNVILAENDLGEHPMTGPAIAYWQIRGRTESHLYTIKN